MKWFVILAVMVGGYYVMLMAGTSLVLEETLKMQQQYITFAEQADQIANGGVASSR